MKNIILLHVFIFSYVYNNAQTTFQKSLVAIDDQQSFGSHQTNDGGYIIAGNTGSNSTGFYSVFLIKTNYNGDSLWSKKYVAANTVSGRNLKQTSDGGYIIVGSIWNLGVLNENIFLLRLDSIGNIIWEKTFEGNNFDRAQSVIQAPDGGFIIVGETNSFSASNTNIYLIKTDSNGNEIWAKVYGGPFTTRGNCIINTSDGGYVIAGYLDSTGTGVGSAYLLKIDGLGNIVWSKAFSGGRGAKAYSVSQSFEGGYIMTGEVYVPVGPSAVINHIYLLKTDSNGNLTWSKKFGGCCNDVGFCVKQTVDNGFIVTGSSSSFIGNGLFSNNLFIIKTNYNGIVSWCNYYGNTLNASDWGNSIEQTFDGGYIASGVTTINYYDTYLLKTDSLGVVQCNSYSFLIYDSIFNSISNSPSLSVSSQFFIQSSSFFSASHNYFTTTDPCSAGELELEDDSQINIYPNPANNVLNVQFNTSASKATVIEIMDIAGRVVGTWSYENVAQGQISHIDIGSLTSGTYLLNIKNENGNSVQKLVVTK